MRQLAVRERIIVTALLIFNQIDQGQCGARHLGHWLLVHVELVLGTVHRPFGPIVRDDGDSLKTRQENLLL